MTIQLLRRSITILFIWAILAACGTAEQPTATIMPSPSPSLTPDSTPTPALSAEEQRIWGLWRRSAHSSADTNVPCETCHVVSSSGAIINAIHDTEGGSCTQCHVELLEMRAQKPNDLHSNLDCIVCHDPHALKGGCTNSGCHVNVAEELLILNGISITPGHETDEQHGCGSGQCHAVATQVVREGKLTHISALHAFLTCAACHDALNLEVRPLENNIHWDTWLPASSTAPARSFTSHVFQRQVQCERCHFQANPWKLPFPVK